LGEGVYGKIVAKMREDPCGEVGKTIGRLDLKLQGLRVLFVFPGPLNVNNQFARQGQRDMTTVIFLNQSERKIDG
jgi:hypothetical protein